MPSFKGLVLAAGMGKRMNSKKAKALHEVCGIPILDHIIKALTSAGATEVVVVVGHEGNQIVDHLDGKYPVVWQHEQLGTGHATMQAEEIFSDYSGNILVMPGDTPLIRPETISQLVMSQQDTKSETSFLTLELDDPRAYGRIVRDKHGKFLSITEYKEATDVIKAIKEVNSGIYCFNSNILFKELKSITNKNEQGEYYLTDVLQNIDDVNVVRIKDATEGMGVNSKVELSQAESVMRERKCLSLMEEGVTIIDPKSTFVDSNVVVGNDTVLFPFTYIKGETTIGSDCVIGPNANITDCIIGDNNRIKECHIISSEIGNNCDVGPYCYIRPGSQIHNNVKIGDFVEIKNSKVGEGSKVPHLSYIGDSVIGKQVNVGCGSITCNYDGAKKYHTVIEDGAFIGSNSNLIAPVIIGKDAYIASGSTITEDVPAKALAIARCKQQNKDGWTLKKKQISKIEIKED